MAKKPKISYVCGDCGADFVRWQGQCNACNAWNTITEFVQAKLSTTSSALNRSGSGTNGGYAGNGDGKATKISEVAVEDIERIPTGESEFDRVLGVGGITLGSVVLASGDPGAGKTTLLTQIAANMSHKMPTMYVTAEESKSQWTKRAKDRLKLNYDNDNLHLSDTDCVETIVEEVRRLGIKFLIADSIQAFESTEVEGSAGGVTQVKTCAKILNRLCKTEGLTLILVGQVNKDSKMAGPQTLKHIIDTTVHIDVTEGSVRLLRSDKNRFGDTDQVGVMQMTGSKGMVSVSNPSRLFLSQSDERFSGAAVCAIKDGARNLLVEIQALVTEVEGEKSMRNCIGVSYNRLGLITQVLKKHGGIRTYYDINVSPVGGLKFQDTETSTDLAVAAALISSIDDKPVPEHSVFIGEISLTGEIRQVQSGVSRVKEALNLGNKQVYVSSANYCKEMIEGIKPDQSVVPIKNIKALIEALR
ncbi:DNA repair protein RadA [Vibrio chagasii]|nr:DNA repair protein RadA [Vibrio chagasii]